MTGIGPFGPTVNPSSHAPAGTSTGPVGPGTAVSVGLTPEEGETPVVSVGPGVMGPVGPGAELGVTAEVTGPVLPAGPGDGAEASLLEHASAPRRTPSPR
jgi:hypothetical protein